MHSTFPTTSGHTSKPFPSHTGHGQVSACVLLSFIINEILYVLKTVNIMKSNFEVPLQLISTFPIGKGLLGLCYHVSLAVLRQQSNSSEISYQRQSSRSMRVLPVTSNLMKQFCVKNCKYTHGKEDRSENGTMKIKKKCRKKRNDTQKKKCRRSVID